MMDHIATTTKKSSSSAFKMDFITFNGWKTKPQNKHDCIAAALFNSIYVNFKVRRSCRARSKTLRSKAIWKFKRSLCYFSCEYTLCLNLWECVAASFSDLFTDKLDVTEEMLRPEVWNLDSKAIFSDQCFDFKWNQLLH